MSARPRPVTASLRYGLPPPPTLPPRARLDDTGDSTLSLISINEHSSAEEDQPVLKAAPQRKKMERKTRHLVAENGSSSGELSAWEKWLVQKEALVRRKLQEDVERQRSKRLEEERRRTEKLEKERAAEENRRRWTQKKQQQARLAETKNVRAEQLRAQLEQEKQRKIAQQTKENYRKWTASKKEQEHREKQKQQEEEERLEREREEKRQKGAEAYEQWLARNKTRPRSAPVGVSYGYTQNGQLKKYHDKGGYPTPNYVNPNPWRDPDVPHYQTDRLAAKVKAKKLARQARPKTAKKLNVFTVKKYY